MQFGRLWWPSWAVLRPSWAALGPSWAVLEASWAILAALVALSGRFGSLGGPQGGAMAAQGTPGVGVLHAELQKLCQAALGILPRLNVPGGTVADPASFDPTRHCAWVGGAAAEGGGHGIVLACLALGVRT